MKNPIEIMSSYKPYHSGNKTDIGKTTGKEHDMGPLIESPDDQHVEPDAKTFVPISSEP